MIEVLKGLPIIGSLIRNLQMMLICGAVLIATNGATGLFSYIKGHNAAAAKCKINSIIRERDEARRDRDNAAGTSKFLKQRLDEISGREAARQQKDTEDAEAAKLKPITGCTVDDVPNSVRRKRPQR